MAEEYHPRWGARTSNPVKSVNDRLGGFNSCLFRQTLNKIQANLDLDIEQFSLRS